MILKPGIRRGGGSLENFDYPPAPLIMGWGSCPRTAFRGSGDIFITLVS